MQDLIDAKEIKFEVPERPNVVTASMPKHGVNAIEEDLFVVSVDDRSEEHTSELQSRQYLVCRLLLEKNFF